MKRLIIRPGWFRSRWTRCSADIDPEASGEACGERRSLLPAPARSAAGRFPFVAVSARRRRLCAAASAVITVSRTRLIAAKGSTL
jgi:hypothetical protein